MASNQQNLYFQPHRIPEKLKTKTFALKWPESSDRALTPIPVDLYIESKGFYLIFINKISKEIECFDLSLIHDTRTGTLVTLPPGAKTCEALHIRTSDESIQSKWLTITYGNSFVPTRDFRLIHFCFESQSIAREWTDQLFSLGHSLHLRHLSNLQMIEKLHSRIVEGVVQITSDEPKICVKDLLEFLCKNNGDVARETRIIRALRSVHLPNERNARILRSDFTFEKFFSFYCELTNREEIRTIFDQLRGNHDEVRVDQFKRFLQSQDDEQASYDWDTHEQKTKEIIRKYSQTDTPNMSYHSFIQYLLSADNSILDQKKFELFMDMDLPLTHYFIASSHNTYLTGLQYRGQSSIEMYRQVLLTGCRCIELDVMDSDRTRAEPEIKHKNTPVRPIWFIDTIVAIRDYAFKTTDYPLILSLENHCSAAAQTRMAKYLVEVFGESLLIEPLSSHPCEENQMLPSPNLLKNKILIKNKKCDPKSCAKFSPSPMRSVLPRTATPISSQSSDEGSVVCPKLLESIGALGSSSTTSSDGSFSPELSHLREGNVTFRSYLPPPSAYSPTEMPTEEIDDFSDDEPPVNPSTIITDETQFQIEPVPEARAIQAMSDLVVYTVPTTFVSFQVSASRNRCYEMISLVEDRANNLRRHHPKDFLIYNQRQLSRIYPRGTRLDSSNFYPHPFWSVGCQLVALNYQTLDLPMQLNLANFSFNGACGYLQKPSVLCQPHTRYDPSSRTQIEDIVPYDVRIKVLSGQFFCQDRTPTFVDVKYFGVNLEAPRRAKRRFRVKDWNGFQAIYDDNDRGNAEFLPINLPAMASIRIAALQDDLTMIGQVLLPVTYLRPGYHHVVLRNAMNICSTFASLFVLVERIDHLPVEHKTLADILVKPNLKKQTTSESDPGWMNYFVRDWPTSTNSTTSSQDQLSNLSTNDERKSVLVDEVSSINVRIHSSSSTEINPNTSFSSESSSGSTKSSNSVFSDQTDWYKKHLIASSSFQRPNELCHFFTLNEFEQRTTFQQLRKSMETKMKTFLDEQNKILKKEEEKFQKHCLGINRSRSMSQQTFSSSNEIQTNSWKSSASKKSEDFEKKLLNVYRKCFHQREEFESSLLMNYYNQLQEAIRQEFENQEKILRRTLNIEIKRTKDMSDEQRRREELQLKSIKDKKKSALMKETIAMKIDEITKSTIKIIEEMCLKIVAELRNCCQTILTTVDENCSLEYERCFAKYETKYNEIKLRFENESNENNNDSTTNSIDTNSSSTVYLQPRMTAIASLSAGLPSYSTDPSFIPSTIIPQTFQQ